MSRKEDVIAEKGRYRLYKIVADGKTYFEIHSKGKYGFIMETSFDNQDAAYRQYAFLTRKEK